MPKITRKQQKVFAVNASNNGVFGSLQANDPVYSQDPDVIQGRTAYSNGWNDATYSAELLPPLEEFQALQYLFSRQIAYLMQEGVPEWNSATTYYKGALVKAVQQDGSFILYASLIDDNTGNQVTDTTKWVITNTSTNFHQGIPNWRSDVIYSDGDWVKNEVDGKWTIFESLKNNNLNNAVSDTDYWIQKPFGLGLPLFLHIWSDHELDDQSWLRADTFSWQDGTFYVDAYNHLVSDYNSGTLITETIGSYTITYRLASDGHMITTDETTVQNIYIESGVAWYYILDTTNQRFKLPRINSAKEGLLQTAPTTTSSTANNYAPVSLYWNVAGSSTKAYGDSNSVGNGKRMIGIDENGYTHQVSAYVAANTFVDNIVAPRNLVTNLSSATSIYKGNMYLYFYVGQFSQTATEQTAGLNTELFNGKADRDLNNLTSQAGAGLNSVGVRTVVETYKNGKNWYRIWSDGWIEQGGSYTTTGTYNFLKPFTDTNYCWTSGGFNNSAEYVTYQRDAALDRTTTSFRVIAGQHSTWYACGY